MNKKILLILWILSLSCHIYGQNTEFKQLAKIQNKTAMVGLKSAKGNTLGKYLGVLNDTNKLLSYNCKASKYQKFESHNVQQVLYYDGSYHIADYVDGTRVVTCLDGDHKGLQGISFNGVIKAESRDVKWKKGYFIHTYPGGTITSYPNKQISELK